MTAVTADFIVTFPNQFLLRVGLGNLSKFWSGNVTRNVSVCSLQVSAAQQCETWLGCRHKLQVLDKIEILWCSWSVEALSCSECIHLHCLSKIEEWTVGYASWIAFTLGENFLWPVLTIGMTIVFSYVSKNLTMWKITWYVPTSSGFVSNLNCQPYTHTHWCSWLQPCPVT